MFDNQPAILELFGRQTLAGRVTEAVVGGHAFFRIDVPTLDGVTGFTKIFGGAAIYAITPVDETTMLNAVRTCRRVPIQPWKLETPARLTLVDGQTDGDEDADADETPRSARF